MASPIMILARLVKDARNADDALQTSEVRAYALEHATLTAIAEAAGMTRHEVRGFIDAWNDDALLPGLAAVLKGLREKTRDDKADAADAAAQALATKLGTTAKRTFEGFDLDADLLFAAAKAGNASSAIGFSLPGAPDENMLDVSVRQLRALSKEADAQRWHVTARLVRDHVQTRTETVWTNNRQTTRTRDSKMPGWGLVIEWLRASGAKGTLRFRHNTEFAGKCAAVVHVGLAENENATAA